MKINLSGTCTWMSLRQGQGQGQSKSRGNNHNNSHLSSSSATTLPAALQSEADIGDEVANGNKSGNGAESQELGISVSTSSAETGKWQAYAICQRAT